MACWSALAVAALVAVAVPAAAVETGGGAKKAVGGGRGWGMRHHSFMRTMSYDDVLGDWLSSAGTMALRDRVQLLPPVPDRYGALWAKQAVATKDFEARFTLSGIASAGNKKPEDAAVAFWISEQDLAKDYNEQAIVTSSKDWLQGSRTAGLTFLQNRPNFKGLAVVLLGLDSKKDARQSVAAMWNDGKDVALEDFVEGSKGTQVKFVDWVSDATQVKVRVKPDGSIRGSIMALDVKAHLGDTVWSFKQDGINVVAYVSFLKDGRVRVNDGPPTGTWEVSYGGTVLIKVEGLPPGLMVFRGALLMEPQAHVERGLKSKLEYIGPTQPTGKEPEAKEEDHWVDLFSFPPGTLKSEESFLGFSGWTGSKTSIEVNLHHLELLNFDASKVGEQDRDVLGDSQVQWLKILEEEKRFLDRASQTEAVERLTKLLTEHVDKYTQLGEHVKTELGKLDKQADDLSMEMGQYYTMAQAWVFDTQSFDPKAVRDHISGLHTILTRDKDKHDAALDKVNAAAAQLKAKRGASSQLNDEGKAKVQAVSDLSKSVEDLAEKGSMQTNGLLLVMVVSVAGLGLLFLNRMRYYEKKHYI